MNVHGEFGAFLKRRRKPRFQLPPGATDAHCHVFGPEAKFPFAPKRKYTPCDASKDQLWALRDFLGFDKNVIVQATCHDTDNRALVDALIAANGKAKGIAFIDESFSDGQLRELDLAGNKGVRFNFIKRLVDSTPKDVMQRIAARIAKLGWHIVIYFEHADLEEMGPFLTSLPTALVFDPFQYRRSKHQHPVGDPDVLPALLHDRRGWVATRLRRVGHRC